VNATFTSACSKVVIQSTAFNLNSPYDATLKCSVLDPSTVETGLTPVSSVVSLTLPTQEGAINYPFEFEAILQPSQALLSSGRRRLLQQSSLPGSSSASNVKVGPLSSLLMSLSLSLSLSLSH
jgi:hypothetical protein